EPAPGVSLPASSCGLRFTAQLIRKSDLLSSKAPKLRHRPTLRGWRAVRFKHYDRSPSSHFRNGEHPLVYADAWLGIAIEGRFCLSLAETRSDVVDSRVSRGARNRWPCWM